MRTGAAMLRSLGVTKLFLFARKSSFEMASVESVRFGTLICAPFPTTMPLGFTSRKLGLAQVCGCSFAIRLPMISEILPPVTRLSTDALRSKCSVSPLAILKSFQLMTLGALTVKVPPFATVPPTSPVTLPVSTTPPVGIACPVLPERASATAAARNDFLALFHLIFIFSFPHQNDCVMLKCQGRCVSLRPLTSLRTCA